MSIHLTPPVPALAANRPVPTRRILALWFPHWDTQVSAASFDPDKPFALVENRQSTQRLAALTPLADALGLSVDMPLADARALLPDLQTAMYDPTFGAQKLQDCAVWLQRYTPWIGHDTQADTRGLLLDISGCAHLFGGERQLLQDMQARFGKRGIDFRAGLAGTIGCAWGLARFAPHDITILPPGQEAEIMLTLPPAALRLPPAQVDLCQRLGLKQIAELACFPRSELTRRFGKLPVMRLEQALGDHGEALSPCLPPPQFMVQQGLAQGIVQVPALAVLVEKLAAQLAAQLADAGQGAQRLDMQLMRSDNMVLGLAVQLAHPSHSPTHMARLLSERLERLQGGFDAGFGIEHIKLVAGRVTALATAQEKLALNGRQALSAPRAALAGLVDRLSNRLGAKVVVRPVLQPSHIPEQAVRYTPALSPAEAAEAAAMAAAPCGWSRPLFMLCAPEPIEVIAEIPEGAPFRFRWRRVLHEVVSAQGPERISPEWWPDAAGHNSQTRDYFRVEDSQGYRFWLYREGLYGRETGRPDWFMHGVFA